MKNKTQAIGRKLSAGQKSIFFVGEVLLILASYILSVCLYKADGTLANMDEFSSNFGALQNDILVIFNWKYVNKTFFMIAVLLSVFYLLLFLVWKLKPNKYVRGREYGSAEFIDVNEINKLLASAALDSKYIIKSFDKNKKTVEINTENRPISSNLSINVNGNKVHRRNLNMLVVGGSGAGKTQFVVRPILMQQSGSFIITDPKGEILQSTGEMLKEAGYKILVFNLLDANGMLKSNHYNPFKYIKSQTDILKLITNLIKNTKPPEATQGDPFWENAEKLLLQAIFFYVWMECEERERNFRKVMELLEKAEFQEDARGQKLDSELDKIFSELESREKERNDSNGNGGVCRHPAVLAYNKVMRGAADTVRSIIISANARLACINNEILTLLDSDEFNISEIGAGVNYDGKTKTAVFCVIPDNDKTYSFLIGMLYTQIFQQLYFYADFLSGKRSLPIPVTFVLDEFANVALPDDFLSLLSTMRSRNISSIPIIQNFAQIKGLYKDNWENIPGNCDILLYLGGNEQSTHEYVSKSLGEGTYDKDSSSETKGRQGSSSHSFDKFGRKLMTESEVREIDNEKCLVFVRGFKPVEDFKYDTFSHPLWYKVADANYAHDARNNREEQHSYKEGFELICQEMYEAFKKKEEYDNETKLEEERTRTVFEFTYEQLMAISIEDGLEESTLFSKEQLEENERICNKMLKDNEAENAKAEQMLNSKYLKDVMILRKNDFSMEQVQKLIPFLDKGKSAEDVLVLFSSSMGLDEIEAYVEMI